MYAAPWRQTVTHVQVSACRRALTSLSCLHLIQHLWQNSPKTVDCFASHHWKVGTYTKILPSIIRIFMLPSSALGREPGSSASS